MNADRPARREPFGRLLKRLRLAAGLSQEALAERAGVSWRTISDLERGVKQGPRPSTLRLLADGLAVSADERAALQASAFPPAAVVAPLGVPSRAPHAPLPTNLPLALSSFVGRDQDLATVRRLLAQTRLLTLTGAGGCGKTRLALEVTRALAAEAPQATAYADGLWLVELAALGDSRLVPQAMARVLGVQERRGHALLESLTTFLQPRHVLLLLDNCEHLLPACAELAEALLRVCPHLTILATSREALGIEGERPWRVPSLRLPDPRRVLSEEQVLACEAVQLFVERAQVVCPQFAPRGPRIGLMVQVCRRLDGIPLAIELAAARLAVLPLDQLSARLDDRFGLLRGGTRTALPRQQTLRATLDWSYDLLSESERLLLRRLAVFAGGWTLEAAEAVCTGAGLAAEEVLEVLTGLVAKSLVQLEEGSDGGRYVLLETVRQYGWEKLAASGEGAAPRVQERHLDWYVALAKREEPGMGRPEQEAGLARLEADLENLRAALAWSSLDESRRETGLWLAEALREFWNVRGHAGEGRRWLEELLPSARRPSLRARALDALADMLWRQGDRRHALTLFEESCALHDRVGNGASAAHALVSQGMVTCELGDYPRATALLERALPLLREEGARHGVAWALGALGEALRLRGDYAAATARLEEGQALFEELGDKQGKGYVLLGLACLARDHGDMRRAGQLYKAGLRAFHALLDRTGCATYLEWLAVVAAAERRPARAARLFGAAHVLHETLGTSPDDVVRTIFDRTVVDVRAALGEEDWAAAWAAGRAMELEEAIAYALQEDEPA